jgi:hypothetical protein
MISKADTSALCVIIVHTSTKLVEFMTHYCAEIAHVYLTIVDALSPVNWKVNIWTSRIIILLLYILHAETSVESS